MEPKRNTFCSLQNLLEAFLIILALVELSSQIIVAATQESSEHAQCSGSMVECVGQMAEEELSMESEASRRTVRAIKYLSPGSLRPDEPICAKATKGESYSNCLPPSSNSYNQGCNSYNRCRS